jgi:rRNA maturation protein Rpf1
VIAITTGRQTSQRLNTLLKELAYTVPNSKIVRRGKSSKEQLAARLFESGFSRVVMLHRWHGGPGRIDFYDIKSNGLNRIFPSIVLRGVRLRREFQRGGSHLAQAIKCDSEASAETQRFAARLGTILELPLMSVKEYSREKGVIQVADGSADSVHIVVAAPHSGIEVGPRLTVSKLVWNANEEKNLS